MNYDPWSFDRLWNKATVYAARAHEQDREGEEFPFWSLLVLELVGRSVLAYTHPALLADGRGDDNIMTVFGFGKAKEPRSIAANLAFKRCSEIVDAFSDKDANRCIGLMEFRNREVHTGEPVFAGWSTSAWLTDYYRILKILVLHVDKSLEDLLGTEDASHAEEILNAAEKQNIADVAKKINAAKTYFFDVMSENEREQKNSEAAVVVRERIVELTGRKVKCPICSSDAALTGKLVRRTEAHLDEGELVSEITLQPSTFSCAGCRLSLESLSDLFAASKTNNAFDAMTNPFTLKEKTSIEAYFEEYFEDFSDYGEYMDE